MREDEPDASRIPRLRPAGRAVPEAGPDAEFEPGLPRLPKGLFVTPSNFWFPESPAEAPLRDQKTFRTFVQNVRSVGAGAVYLYPTHAGKAIWPSRFVQSMDRDLLQEFCEEMRGAGLEVHIYYMERDPYFGPLEGYRNPIQCLWQFRDRWTNVLKEIVSRDIGGLCVPPDEYWWPVHVGMPGPDDPCTLKFREWYGFDPPPELAGNDRDPALNDTPEGRAWIEFGYRSIAEIFAAWNDIVKRLNPHLVRTNILHIDHMAYNRRDNVDYGLIGHSADWTCLMTDPYVSLHTRLKDRFYVPETVKLLAAGTPNRLTHVTLQNQRLEKHEPVELRPVDVYGSAVSALASGAKGVYFFHYNRIFDRQTAAPVSDHFPHTARAFGLMRTLDRWGISDARVPGAIALLYSRRSQDYAGLRLRANLGNGYDAHEAACDLLFSEGYPFDLYYVEQTQSWRNLPEARVLILPFGYALSDAEVGQLETHVRAGKHLLLLQRLGEADEKGQARTSPVLSGLLERYPDRVVQVAGDVGFRQADPAYRGFFYAALNAHLSDARLLCLDRLGADVEVTALALPEKRLLVFAINWESRPVEITLGLHLGPGAYRLTERNQDGVQPARLSGKARIEAVALGRFSVGLGAEGVKIWLVEPVT